MKHQRGGQKRAFRSKREFHNFCQRQVAAGKVNQADGSWKQVTGSPTTNEHHMFAGYKLVGAMVGKRQK